MRFSFSALFMASPLYLATNSPFFADSSRYNPRPAFLILDLAIFTLFGLTLGLGWYRRRFGRRGLVLAPVSTACGCCRWLTVASLCFAVMLRVRLCMLHGGVGVVRNEVVGVTGDDTGGPLIASLSLL